ncbi:response regulator [Profundibacterium mesophilum]|uniref:Response regulator receiver n=1 Tax=Profundibacterium mesophilum KAUST100406-0324 TaxID=1037889 RepID=A0A921NZN2_9RHOB|nr:response regulator transcription factor [Profundibacterium mesophilum]KAF0676478.1 Response regulator receiver [Profundibacterium mesophilum KAUST100406-0324]
MRILAVDDDSLLLELMEITLQGAGYVDVDLASSADEALAQIANSVTPYECILLDIQMPGTDGIELCAHIRSLHQYKTTPILMITAMTERSFVERAFAAGANDYVSKPFDPFELVTRLRLAGETVRQNRVVAEKVFALKNLRNAVEEKSRFLPTSPVLIEDVTGVVDQVVLENYVLQLSRGEAFQTAAFAFKIREFDTIYAQSSPSEIYLTLTDVAEAIANQLKQTSFLMAYTGSGVFTCITRRNAACLTDELCQFIQYDIDEMALCYDDGRPCTVTLAMGEPQTKSRLFGGSPTDIITNAIAAVNTAPGPRRMGGLAAVVAGGVQAGAS